MLVILFLAIAFASVDSGRVYFTRGQANKRIAAEAVADTSIKYRLRDTLKTTLEGTYAFEEFITPFEQGLPDLARRKRVRSTKPASTPEVSELPATPVSTPIDLPYRTQPHIENIVRRRDSVHPRVDHRIHHFVDLYPQEDKGIGHVIQSIYRSPYFRYVFATVALLLAYVAPELRGAVALSALAYIFQISLRTRGP